MSLAAAYIFGFKQANGINIPLENFISYWKFDGNANDSVGTNNGTATNVTFPTGLIGNAADFNGTTSKVVVPDADNLSFGNGSNDVDFSTIVLIKGDDFSNLPRIFTKINANLSGIEYTFSVINENYRSTLVDLSPTTTTVNTANDTIITTSQWLVLTSTYKASTKTLKVYVDNNVINTDLSSGGYVAMENSVSDLFIGNDPRFNNGNTLNGQMNALSFLNVELTPEQVSYAVNKLKVDNIHLIDGLVTPIEPADIISAYKFENNFIDSKGTNSGTGTGVTFNNSIKIAGSESAEFAWTTTPDYVTIPYSTDFDFSAVTNSKPFSISMWVYMTEDKSSWFINKRDLENDQEFQLLYSSGDFVFVVFDAQRRIDTGINSDIRSSLTASTSVVGRWINLVGVFDGVTDCKLYVDKVAGSSAVNTNSFAKIKNYNQNIVLGTTAWEIPAGTTTRSFKGYMDETYIYNKTLTTGQITYLYDKGIAGQSLIGEPIEQSDFVSYYEFNNNANDTIGTNNGTPTDLTYESGLVGNRGVFNGTSSEIDIADSDSLSFTDGVNDKPFAISLLVTFDTLSDSSALFTKYQSGTPDIFEYGLMCFGNSLNFAVFKNNDVNSRLQLTYTLNRVVGQRYLISVSYDGSKTLAGLKLFIDQTEVTSSSSISEVGTYTGMSNTVALARIGYRGFSTPNYHNGTYDQIAILNRAITLTDQEYIFQKYQAGQSLI